MNHTNILRGFYVKWEAIEKLSKEEKPYVPVLSKNVTPMKWMASFQDCLSRIFGVRMCPITYVIRENETVPSKDDEPIDLANSRAYSNATKSVLNELIRRLSHNHPLYKSDNNLVYSLLDEATRGTIYAPTIKLFARTKDGWAAWQAILSSHAGSDKWEQLQKDRMKFLMTFKWNGKTYSLKKYTGLHRSAYSALRDARQHVDFQLPNQQSRVTYLLDNIINNDPDLRAALASIRANMNNMRENFEDAVTFLLPLCPYAKHRLANRNNTVEISDKTLRGRNQSKTGVEFRWYTKEEYSKLTPDQRSELWEWQNSKEGKAKIKSNRKNLTNTRNKGLLSKQPLSKVS